MPIPQASSCPPRPFYNQTLSVCDPGGTLLSTASRTCQQAYNIPYKDDPSHTAWCMGVYAVHVCVCMCGVSAFTYTVHIKEESVCECQVATVLIG